MALKNNCMYHICNDNSGTIYLPVFWKFYAFKAKLTPTFISCWSVTGKSPFSIEFLQVVKELVSWNGNCWRFLWRCQLWSLLRFLFNETSWFKEPWLRESECTPLLVQLSPLDVKVPLDDSSSIHLCLHSKWMRSDYS